MHTMSRAPLLILVLSALCAGSRSEAVLSQPLSVSVLLGGTATLPCVLGTGYSTSYYYVYWYQQRPGAPPRYLLYYKSSLDRPSTTPARFAASKDPTSNTCTLSLTGAQAEDAADYYCAIYENKNNKNEFIFGGGTQLNVLSGEIKAPTLSIFPPSTEEIATQKATLVCQCQDFYPAALSWTWTVNGETITSGVGSTRPTKQTDNNLFMAGSLLSIDAIDWNADKKYTCVATHEGKTFQASVKHSECV